MANNIQGILLRSWDELEQLDRQIYKEGEKLVKDAKSIKPSYDAGTYRDESDTVRYSNYLETSAFDEVRILIETIGLPRRIGIMGIMGSRPARALEVLSTLSESQIWQAAIHITSHSEGLIDKAFSRVEVARMPMELVEELIAKLRSGIEYGLTQISRDDRSSWVEATRRKLELISRLVVRSTPEDALESFRWARSLADHIGMVHWWLFEPFQHLLQRALEAIPKATLAEVSWDILSLPLPQERNLKGQLSDWPELAPLIDATNFAKRDGAARWGLRISELIELVSSGDTLHRTNAILRLMPLYESKFLDDDEVSELSTAIWSKRQNEGSLPSELTLYGHAFLMLPEPSTGICATAFHNDVIAPMVAGNLTEGGLIALSNAFEPNQTTEIVLSPPDALEIFDQCMKCAKTADQNHDKSNFYAQDDRRFLESLGRCLDKAVLPGLTADMLGADRVDQLLAALEAGEIKSLILIARRLIVIRPDLQSRVISQVRRSLAGHDEHTVFFGINAVDRFVQAADDVHLEIPPVFIADVASLCATRREPGLLQTLWLARRMQSAGLLQPDEQNRIIDGLEFLFAELRYEDWDVSDPRTKVLSLLRAQCVQLAVAMNQGGRTNQTILDWIKSAAEDPVPEVRFARDNTHG